MSGMQPKRVSAPKRPRFLWRGLLIVLPALAMAGFGFVSLRQDRLLARHQAAEEADKLALELIELILPAALRLDIGLPALARPQDDPIMAARQDGLIVALLDDTGDLVHPPPFRWPIPEPLEFDMLSAEQLDRWETARRELFRGDDRSVAQAHFEDLLTEVLPVRFEALARFHLFELALRNAASGGLEQLGWLRGLNPSVRSESGLPLRLLTEWRWLRSIDPDVAAELVLDETLSWVCAAVVSEPSPISQPILQRLREIDSEIWQVRTTRTWLPLWAAHQEARRFFELLNDVEVGSKSPTESSPTGWIDFEDSERLVLSQSVEGGAWWVAWPEDGLRARVRRILDVMSLPAYLGCEVKVGGRTITAPAETASALATVSDRLDSVGGVELAATVWLADPDLLYARQRKRTWWFGSLIAISATSVLCGVVAAWRGFRDQQRASDMKSNFVSSVSHEMRAPIASVRLMAEELVDRGGGDAVKAGEYHGYILQECRRLSALIENVLDFSRHEQGRKEYRLEPTDLVPVVDETIQVMRSYAAERKVTLECQVTGAPFEINVDAAAIQQVLVNLIDNAIKHSPPGASVRVEMHYPQDGRGCMGKGTPSPQPSPPEGAREDDPSPQPSPPEGAREDDPSPQPSPPEGAREDDPSTQTQSATHGWVQLSVRDAGPGIPIEEQRRIFERFYRCGTELRRETQGIGLGLAIVSYIVEAHGGNVRVDSHVGHGSRFVVELPPTQGKVS
jgi:signal transduction histidine kinase